MKHIKLYEEYSESAGIPLSEEKREEYIKELAKHITYPEVYEKSPETWSAMVMTNTNIVVDDDEVYPFNRENIEKMEKYINDELLGTPQHAYDDFFSYMAHKESEEDDADFHILKGKNVKYYMRKYGKTEEVAKIMKTLYDDVEVVGDVV
jgi:hypothetical protein